MPSRDRLAALLAAAMLGGLATAQALPRSPAEYLARMDADGDGRISLAEYQDYLSRGFLEMDRNGDGVLAREELPPGARTRRAPTLEGHLRALAATFDRQDADNDGHLDARELAAPPR